MPNATTDSKNQRDLLFLLTPGFEDEAFPGKRFYCESCATLEGVIRSFPHLCENLEIRRVAFKRPRSEVVAFVGEENQGLPLLILAPGAKSEFQTGQHREVAFVAGTTAILKVLTERHAFPERHP